jgi:hyperosmotically inducible protein
VNKLSLALVLSSAVLGTWQVSRAQNPPPAANNSAVNVRDRNPDAMTAGQQSNAKGDIELTSQIRRAVVKDGTLSMTAHNIKIVSSGGIVTLRGPVQTEGEKQSIGRKARAIAGAKNVDNQLEVENH